VAAAEGNPLFIEQLAAVLIERGSEAAGSLPTTIRGLVAARLDALPAEERDVILDASIVGRSFWRGALERIARDPDCLADALAALERRDLVRRDAVRHFVAAAEEAERGWAKQLAVSLYKEALDMTPAEDVDRVRFLRKRLAVAQQAYIHVDDAQLLGLGSGES
jgi:predicted ATPase